MENLKKAMVRIQRNCKQGQGKETGEQNFHICLFTISPHMQFVLFGRPQAPVSDGTTQLKAVQTEPECRSAVTQTNIGMFDLDAEHTKLDVSLMVWCCLVTLC